MTAMPELHALLGPSSAHRWMVCTPSARLEEGLVDKGSEYAQEGTLAHRLGELLLRQRWEGADIATDLAAVEADPLYSAAMREHMEGYVAFIEERVAEARTRCADPRVFIEQTVRFDDYVPEGFGTADCIILADGLMDVIDLKYGAGVPVSAEDNPQMRIYGLGCYLALSWVYQIDNVRMTIYQPRLDSISTDAMTSEDLLAWADTELKPKAALAWEGTGDFNPGEHQCKWCKIAATCRARAEHQLQLAAYDFAQPPTLTPEEVADVLTRLPDLLAWADQVKAYAMDAAINKGLRFPGFKVVEGRSNRKYTNEHAIFLRLKKAGYPAAELYKPKELLGITAMEKLVGKKHLEELVGGLIEKPAGAPTLVPETDKRPELNTAAQAAEDFKEEN